MAVPLRLVASLLQLALCITTINSALGASSSVRFLSCTPQQGENPGQCASCSGPSAISGTTACYNFDGSTPMSAWATAWNAKAAQVQCVYPTGNGGDDDPQCVTISQYEDAACTKFESVKTILCGTCHPSIPGSTDEYISTQCLSDGNVLVKMKCTDALCKQCDATSLETDIAQRCSQNKIASAAFPCIEARVTLHDKQCASTNQSSVITQRHSPNAQCMHGDFYAECRAASSWEPPGTSSPGESLSTLHLEAITCASRVCIEPTNETSTCFLDYKKDLANNDCFRTATGDTFNPSWFPDFNPDALGSRTIVTCPPSSHSTERCADVTFFQGGSPTEPKCGGSTLFGQYTFVCGSKNLVWDPRADAQITLEVTCSADSSTVSVAVCNAETGSCDTPSTFRAADCTDANPKMYIEGLSSKVRSDFGAIAGSLSVISPCATYYNTTYRNALKCEAGGGPFTSPEKLAFRGVLPQRRCTAGGMARCVSPSAPALPWPGSHYVPSDDDKGGHGGTGSELLVAARSCSAEWVDDRFVYSIASLANARNFSNNTCVARGTINKQFSVKGSCGDYRQATFCARVKASTLCQFASFPQLPSHDFVCGGCQRDLAFGNYYLSCPTSLDSTAPLVVRWNCSESCTGCAKSAELPLKEPDDAPCVSVPPLGGFSTHYSLALCSPIVLREWLDSDCNGPASNIRYIAADRCDVSAMALSCVPPTEQLQGESFFHRYKTYLALFVMTFLLLIAVTMAYGRLHQQIKSRQELYAQMNSDMDDGSNFGHGGAQLQQHKQHTVQMTRYADDGDKGSDQGLPVASTTHPPSAPVSIVSQAVTEQQRYASEAAKRTLDDLGTLNHSA